jgi:hypothetical protein
MSDRSATAGEGRGTLSRACIASRRRPTPERRQRASRPVDVAGSSARRSSRYGLADRQPAPEVPAHAAPAPPIHRVSPAKQRDHPCVTPSHGLICASSTARNEPALCRPRQRQLVDDRRQAAEAELHDAADEVGAGSQTAVAESQTRARCAKPCGRSAGQRLEPARPGWPDPRRSGAPPAARRTLRSVALPPPGYAREPRRLGLIGAAHDGSAESRPRSKSPRAGRAAHARAESSRSRATSIWTSARTDHGSSPRPRRGARGIVRTAVQTVPEAEAVRASGAVVRGDAQRAGRAGRASTRSCSGSRRHATGVLLDSVLRARARRTLPP